MGMDRIAPTLLVASNRSEISAEAWGANRPVLLKSEVKCLLKGKYEGLQSLGELVKPTTAASKSSDRSQRGLISIT